MDGFIVTLRAPVGANNLPHLHLSRYGLLAIFDHAHRLHKLFYILPSIGISAGGQFFVFFQMFFAYTSDIADVRGEDSKTKFSRFLIAEVCVYQPRSRKLHSLYLRKTQNGTVSLSC